MAKSKILIVDDNLIARNVVKGILTHSQHSEDYELSFATNGMEAIEKAAELTPDLIILDVMMPDLDGFEVCRYLRDVPRLAEVPIVLVTALDDKDSRLEGINAGADDFITKPVDEAELIARVHTIIRLNRYRRLHAERARFEWVIAQSEDGYVVINDQDQVLYANHQAFVFFGSDPQEERPLGNFLDLVRKQYKYEPAQDWQSWPLGQMNIGYLVRPETALANAFWIQITKHEYIVGSEIQYLVRMQNVTQQMNTQRDMQTFRSTVMHKLRTPLTVLLTSLQLLEMDADKMTPEMVEAMSYISQSANNLESDVEDMLKFLQAPMVVRSGELGGGFCLESLDLLTSQIYQRLELNSLQVICPESLKSFHLKLSEEAMEWLLWEILENAKKFHPQQLPNVEIVITSSNENKISIKISDDGVLLSPEQISQAWLPFYQGEKDFTGSVKGMGLGLSTIAALVWEAGGNCSLYNREYGPGVVVALTIPISSSVEERNGTNGF